MIKQFFDDFGLKVFDDLLVFEELVVNIEVVLFVQQVMDFDGDVLVVDDVVGDVLQVLVNEVFVGELVEVFGDVVVDVVLMQEMLSCDMFDVDCG